MWNTILAFNQQVSEAAKRALGFLPKELGSASERCPEEGFTPRSAKFNSDNKHKLQLSR